LVVTIKEHIIYVVPLPSRFPCLFVEFSHQVAQCAFHGSPFRAVVLGGHHSTEGDRKNYMRKYSWKIKGNKQQTNIHTLLTIFEILNSQS